MDPLLGEKLFRETILKATTSGGKGGQHVNKVATRVELFFDINNSLLLTDEQKALLNAKLSNRISNEGVLRITCSEKRSQIENKQLVKSKFVALIVKAFSPKKKRTRTFSTKASIEDRLRKKKLLSEKKQLRSGLDF